MYIQNQYKINQSLYSNIILRQEKKIRENAQHIPFCSDSILRHNTSSQHVGKDLWHHI